MAEITNVSVRLFNKKNNNLKAFVQVELDSELVLTGIKLVKGNKGFFLGMPSQKWDSDEEYHDIYFPITGEFREELTEAVVDAYKQAKKEEEEDDDIYLDEFEGDIDKWVIDALKAIGMETAKDVMKAPREMLISRGDLEEETVDEVLRILNEEFEEE